MTSDCEEDPAVGLLDWGKDKREAAIANPPGAKYGAASESLRHTIPEARVCAMFCKGKNCKFESATYWKEHQMEVKGLYSNWITKNILAMARPNTPNIAKYDLIAQFKEHGIASIINLQLPGEHCTCGPPLEPEGFSYKQQEFMDNDIFFYNFGWQDYGVGSLSNILDMVKVVQFAVSEGKVAVHCHAGLGRTGVLIACYLVYAHRMQPWEVVHYIRSRRPPSVQTRSQILCIQEFSQYLKPLRIVFSSVESDAYDFNLAQFLTRQKNMLHGFEARKLKFTPKLVYECCERLLVLAGHGHKQRHHQDSRHDVLKTAPSALHNKGPVARSLSTLKPLRSISSGQDSSPLNPLRAKSISLESFTAVGNLKHVSSSQSISSTNSDSDSALSYLADRHDGHSNQAEKSSDSYSSADQPTEVLGSESVGRAMGQIDVDAQIRAATEEIKCEINKGEEGWKKLRACTDPVILATLMWDWLDHLKEPLLQAQDLPHMLEHTGIPLEGMQLLNKGTQCTVELVFRTIARLAPLSDDAERGVVQRALSVLSHQNMVVEADPVLFQEKSLLRRTSNNTGLMRGNVATRMMYFFMHLLHILQEDQTQQEVELSRQRREHSAQDSRKSASKKSPLKQNRDRIDKARTNGFSSSRRKSFEAEDKDIYARKSDNLQIVNRGNLGKHHEEDESQEEQDFSDDATYSSQTKSMNLNKKLPPVKASTNGYDKT